MVPARLLPILTAAGLSLAGVLGIVVATTLLYELAPAARGKLPAAAAVASAVYIGLALLLARAARSTELLAFIGLERPSLAFALVGVGLGIFLHGPVDFVEATMGRWFPLPAPEMAERLARLAPRAASERVLNLLAVAGLVPLAEEAFFRGALWRVLRASTGATAALLTTSALFTVSHAEPRSFPALALMAISLGVVRVLSGSLWPAVLLHAAFNATTLLVIFLEPPTRAPDPSWSLFCGGSALSAALLLVARRLASEARVPRRVEA